MNLYLDNGYLDIPKILQIGMPFTFVVGGRGTGKTYGALTTVVKTRTKFILMRRTQSQVDLINKDELSPFKSINRDMHCYIGSKPLSKYNVGFYMMEQLDDDKWVPGGDPIGYSCALSTISNLRGFDASDVKLLIYDEFIPEKHERPIKNEGAAFLNAYETINRNRELSGQKPLQVLALANANDLGNEIFMELNIVRVAETMRKKGQELYINPQRGICLVLLQDSPISQKKADTALYRASEGGTYSDMALNNKFAEEEPSKQKSMPLKEYKPVVAIGEICIYKHKSTNKTYISSHRSGKPQVYGTGETERKRFALKYSWLYDLYYNDAIVFEDYICELLFCKYLL